jgi:phosphomannomutase/phosphoglucomutase
MYDIRGIIDKDIGPEVFAEIGLSIGTYLGGRGTVIAGRDARTSSDLLEKAVIAGILSSGCNVVNIGRVTTPLLYYTLLNTKDANAGIMITASHNPPMYNGIKLCKKSNSNFVEIIDTDLIKNIFEQKKYRRASFKDLGEEVIVDMLDKYQLYLKTKFSFKRPTKAVLDIGNGTTGFTVDLFRRFGLKVTGLFTEPDGLFPNHVPNPAIEENLAALKREVIKNGADIGIAFDGDGDRLGIVDDKGRVVTSDQIIMLFCSEILRENKGATIIVDVTVSRAIIDYVKKNCGKPEMARVGYPFMQKRLHETGSPFAAEYSGHYYFRENSGYDDGVYAGLMMLRILSASEIKLSEMVDRLPKYVALPEIRVKCPDDEKFAVVDRIKQEFKKNGFQTYDVDGVRVELENGWVLLRASNTEPAVAVRFEADSQGHLEEIRKLTLPIVRKHLNASQL